MHPPEAQLTRSTLTVPLLITLATGALVFLVLAGIFVYGNTRRLHSASNWVEHTQEVLISLQRASQLTERIDYNARLYVLTGDEEDLNRARSTANLLSTAATHIRILVIDNAEQHANEQRLAVSVAKLSQILNGFTRQTALPELEIQQCQQMIGLMTDREQSFLKERNQGTQATLFTSLSTQIGFVVLSLLISLVLFGFLLRDAKRRQQVSKLAQQTNERLEQSVKALEDRAHESGLLTSARDELQLCVNVEQLYQSAANSFSRLLPGSSGCICMMNNSRQMVEMVSSWGQVALEDFSPPESCCGLRSGHSRWRQPGLSEIHCMHFDGDPPERYLCQPIVAHGNTLGILFVQCEDDEIVQSVNLRIDGVTQLLQITGMAVATQNLRTKLENQSIRDPLTGLFNRHFMQISLERELSRAERRGQMLAVFMLDVDHFKRFNDTHGHAAGDTALKAISDIFSSRIRAEDIACRYGGEEFTIMLPDMNLAGAMERAEGIRRSVTNLHVPLGKEMVGEFSISIGVAFYPDDGETADLLLRRADLALYRAKRDGRNQVVLYRQMAEETISSKQ